jgi:hypothetical protein
LHNDEGEEDGVQLRRRDVPGRMISLSQDQYVMLENLPFFENGKPASARRSIAICSVS